MINHIVNERSKNSREEYMSSNITKDEARDIYENHKEYLLKIAILITKSYSLSEDIVSDTFIKVFENYSKYDTSKDLRPWIVRILKNNINMYYRKNKKEILTSESIEIEDSHDSLIEFFTKNDEKELFELVMGLSFKSRQIIVLHYYEGMTLPEISEKLDIPLGTCKSRLNTALNKLRGLVPPKLLMKEERWK